MATNFPDTTPPALNPDTGLEWAAGDTFDDTAESGLVYVWSPPVWKTSVEAIPETDARYVNVIGDNMEGNLTLGPDGGPAEITLNASSGLIQTGGNAGFNPGVNLSQTGNVTVTRANNGEVFRVNRMGTSTPTSVITASGDAEFAGNVQMASQNGGPLAGFRNQIINGDFRIAQRPMTGVDGNEFDILHADYVVLQYTIDRWLVSTNFLNSDTESMVRKIRKYGNIPVAECTSLGFLAQTIEIPGNGDPGPFQQGTTWTLSYYSTTPPNGLTATDYAIFRSYTGGNTNDVFLTCTPMTATGKTLGTGNELVQYSGQITVDAAPNNNCTMLMIFTGGDASDWGVVGTSMGDFDIAYVQLEPGPVATPFEHRPIGTELALCQRYYIPGNSGSAYVPGMVREFGSATGRIDVELTDKPMRTAPNLIGNLGAYNTRPGDSTTNVTVQNVRITGDKVLALCDPLATSSFIRGVRSMPQLDAEL